MLVKYLVILYSYLNKKVQPTLIFSTSPHMTKSTPSMKNKPFLYTTFILSTAIISCTNSNTGNVDPTDKIDSVAVITTVSIPASQDTLNQANNITPTQTVTIKAQHIEKPTAPKQTGPPCALPLVPHFPESDQAMIDFIEENLQYPEAAKKANVTGSVLVGFRVKATGDLTDIKVLKEVGYGCDEEAIRIVKLMPKWIPGKMMNKPIDMDYSLAINFRINN